MGLAQAELVAAAVAKLDPEIILASPLNRTKQTAAALARATGLAVNYDDAWLECSFGIWDGLSIDEVKEKYPVDYHSWLCSTGFAPPQGESYNALAVRIDEALEKIVAMYPGQRVAVVSHNGAIKTAAKLAVGAPADSIFHIDISPCSITTISIWPSDGLRALRGLNEQSHLRENN